MDDAKDRFDYHYRFNTGQYAFYRVPKALFQKTEFDGLSSEAKLLYGMMLDRLELSIRNNWFDEKDRAYIFFTMQSIMDHFHCGHDKALRLLSELDIQTGIGLIERKHQGLGNPDRIYVKQFFEKTEAQSSEKSKAGLLKNRDSDIDKTATKDTEINHTEWNNTEKKEKHLFGDYKNVLLTENEYQALQKDFPDDYDQRIEALSGYMASSGKNYSSHLATIRNWARRDRLQISSDRKKIPDYSREKNESI